MPEVRNVIFVKKRFPNVWKTSCQQ